MFLPVPVYCTHEFTGILRRRMLQELAGSRWGTGIQPRDACEAQDYTDADSGGKNIAITT